MKTLRIGFAGTPDFSVPALQALVRWAGGRDDASLAAVWTQPDRPAGRGRRLAASPVKQAALAHGLTVHQPRTLRDAAALAELVAEQLDLLVVVAYGLILPDAVLSAPRMGCINVHASLLPRWRGAAPIQRALVAGDRVSGVCIMQITSGLDAGPVWRSAAIELNDAETGGSLHDRLAALGARELVEALPEVLSGGGRPVAQDETFATYAHKLAKSEARIDWRDSAAAIARRIRAFDPWPVADTLFEGRQLRVWAAEQVADGPEEAPPGRVVDTRGGLTVACGRGRLRLTRVQLAGGRAIDAADFVNAHACAGTVLGEA